MNEVRAVTPLLSARRSSRALRGGRARAQSHVHLPLRRLSLKDGEAEGLSADEAAAVQRLAQALLGVAIEEMGHLAAVWNITAALGAIPRIGRDQLSARSGLSAGQHRGEARARSTPATLQHFVFLERPHGSSEPDGRGFRLRAHLRARQRGRAPDSHGARLRHGGRLLCARSARGSGPSSRSYGEAGDL